MVESSEATPEQIALAEKFALELARAAGKGDERVGIPRHFDATVTNALAPLIRTDLHTSTAYNHLAFIQKTGDLFNRGWVMLPMNPSQEDTAMLAKYWYQAAIWSNYFGQCFKECRDWEKAQHASEVVEGTNGEALAVLNEEGN